MESSPADRAMPTRGAATNRESPGDLIGRYKLLQQIGEGGCGVVFMAEQEQPIAEIEQSTPSAVNYFVQAGTFADPDNAERLRQEFVNIGPVQVAELMGNDGPVYRMRVGPFDNLNDAQVALNQVHGYGLPDAHLLESHLQQAALQ